MGRTNQSHTVRRFLWASVAAPLFMGAVGAGLQLLILGDLPNQVAVHWDSGGADGFGPRWMLPALTAGLAMGLVVLIPLPIGISFARSREGVAPTNLRFVTGTMWGTTGFLAFGLTATAFLQRGLTDPAEVSGLAPWLTAGFGVGCVLAALGAFAAPRANAGALADNADDDRGSVTLGAQERIVWSQSVASGTQPLIALWTVAGVSAVGTAFALTTNPSQWWTWAIAVPATAMAVILACSLSRIRVTISTRGVRVRSGLGLPLWTSTRESIDRATTSERPPHAGWGVRVLDDGSRGVLIKDGPVLRVHLRGPRPGLVVSVSDADEAAAVLRSIIQPAA